LTAPGDVGGIYGSLSAMNVVLCCDGTGNKLDVATSNVVRLFSIARRDRPLDQVVYYHPGIGTMPARAALTSASRWATKTAGNAAGYGLLDDVADLYAYLMDVLGDHDQLFIFGFSRGAFTARVLAGLIHRLGVLKPEFKSLIPYALDLYRPHRPVDGAHVELDDVVAKFRTLFSRPCSVHFLGLWDTVKAFGVLWPRSLPHLRFNPSVRFVRHALALEESRTMFEPTTWGGTDGDLRGTPASFLRPAMPPRSIEPTQDVKEVWFAGCHSDVGGGLPAAAGGLYKHSLEWMVREAEHRGLLVDEGALQQCLSEAAGEDRKVESLRDWWHLAELALRLHLRNEFPPAWRRRVTMGLWRGRKLSGFHRGGGLKVHDSVPEDVLLSLNRRDHRIHFLPEREGTLPPTPPATEKVV
jgi:uncharacterized protein (DUF2235 family)